MVVDHLHLREFGRNKLGDLKRMALDAVRKLLPQADAHHLSTPLLGRFTQNQAGSNSFIGFT